MNLVGGRFHSLRDKFLEFLCVAEVGWIRARHENLMDRRDALLDLDIWADRGKSMTHRRKVDKYSCAPCLPIFSAESGSICPLHLLDESSLC